MLGLNDGAAVPVLPYLFAEPPRGLVLSALTTLLALFVVGA